MSSLDLIAAIDDLHATQNLLRAHHAARPSVKTRELAPALYVQWLYELDKINDSVRSKRDIVDAMLNKEIQA